MAFQELVREAFAGGLGQGGGWGLSQGCSNGNRQESGSWREDSGGTSVICPVTDWMWGSGG